MAHPAVASALVTLLLFLPGDLGPGRVAAAPPRTLTFEDRLAAQRAIEEVFWRHRIWPKDNPGPKPGLDVVMPEATLRGKVEDTLRKSNALARWWQRPITAQQLQAEMDMLAKQTRDPALLQELFAALGNDPFVIAETLARHSLVERLIRNWHAQDSREIGSKRGFDEWWRSEAAKVGTVDAGTDGSFSLPTMSAQGCAVDTWRPTRSGPPNGSESLSAIWTGAEMIVWGGRNATNAQTGGRYTPATDTWLPTSTGPNVPDGRYSHSAVWTGTEMIVWGGVGGGPLNTGGRYNPSTDSWLPTSIGSNVPTARTNHTAVWTGSEMIVWGGAVGISEFDTGGRYNPSSDSWLPTSIGANTPSARAGHVAVWTGTQMVVWGGSFGSNEYNTGARYSPGTDTWAPTSIGAGVPASRTAASAVWTGSRMIVWGGVDANDVIVNTGGRYDPSTDTWTPTSVGVNVPGPRFFHRAVWTGTEMIVWGGLEAAGALNTGGRYNPASDTWLVTSMAANVPVRRHSFGAVWTNNEMIVWGGYGDQAPPFFDTGARYNPTTDMWIPTSIGADVPTARGLAATVWTGSEMIVWGGATDGSVVVGTGARYTPATDTWTFTSMGVNVPSARFYPSAIWTGTEMIVWGGRDPAYLNTGGRYNSSTDAWLPTSTGANAPSARAYHSTVWTGTEMIVWGGDGPGDDVATGGRYRPSNDSWQPTSTGANVPSARHSAVAVWTGNEMIVWGGLGSAYFDTGGRYNPSSDSWLPTSTGANVPSARLETTALWTGSEMILWGGYPPQFPYATNTGGRYNPLADRWAPTSTGANVPSARRAHSAVWTGTEMIVWAGSEATIGNTSTGGRYDPATDGWTPTAIGSNTPSPRTGHAGVWTGSEMLVWGGNDGTGGFLDTGGRYCACAGACDDGNACTVNETCSNGVCGGGACSCVTAADADGDGHGNPGAIVMRCDASVPHGYASNADDCDDTRAAVHPGAPEVCNHLDDNCTGGTDEGMPIVTWYPDLDSDRYGRSTLSTQSFCPPPGHVRNSLDCDDNDPNVRPGGAENCDGKRNDCNGAGWPMLLDADKDGIENACEVCIDADGDGWGDPGAAGNTCVSDNCPTVANASQSNADFDARGDACDVCPNDPLDDQDGDGRCGDVDNCPTSANSGQENTDGDPFGDACDPCPLVNGDNCPPDDGDGVPTDDGDGAFDPCTGGNRLACDDNCPFDFNVAQRDRDHDGVGDACDPTDDLVQGGTASTSIAGPGVLVGTLTYSFTWEPESDVVGYNVYRGLLTELRTGSYGSCYRNRIESRFTTLPENPGAGSGFFYLVTPVYVEREGSLGTSSQGVERSITNPCP